MRTSYPSQVIRDLEHRPQTGRRSSHLIRRERHVQQPEKVLVFFLGRVGVQLGEMMLAMCAARQYVL